MFDNQRLGGYIQFLRMKQSMTQSQLAERLGISPQAVSNWERGVSMPDIALLAAVSRALGTTTDKMLAAAESYERDGADQEEAAPQAETAPPQAKVIVIHTPEPQTEDSTGNQDGACDFGMIMSLAPFASSEALEKLVENMPLDGVNLQMLTALAPFLEGDALGRLVKRLSVDGQNLGGVIALAPFLEDDDLRDIALRHAKQGANLGHLNGLAPFLDSDVLMEIIKASGQRVDKALLAGFAPFLDSKDVDELILREAQRGR